MKARGARNYPGAPFLISGIQFAGRGILQLNFKKFDNCSPREPCDFSLYQFLSIIIISKVSTQNTVGGITIKSNLIVFERSSRAVVSSRAISERFEKRHDNLLATIQGLIRGILKNKEAPSKYFIRSEYINEQNGQHYPEYLCTRSGFSLLAMGFTGPKALAWKIKYINAFDLMESAIRERKSSEWLMTRKQGKLVRREETDTISQLAVYAAGQGSKHPEKMYTVYSKLVNSLVGISSGQRGEVPFKTLSTIAFLEDMILHTIGEDMAKGVYYKEIYQHCKANGEQIIRFAYLPRIA